MAAASRKYIAFEAGKYKVRESQTEEIIYSKVTVGGSGGKVLSIVSSKWDFNAAKLSNIVAGAASGEAVEYDQLTTALGLKQSTSEKGQPNGYAALDADSLVPITQIPPAALERLVVVADETARFALTTATVQNGDTVKQTDTGEMWFVTDDSSLDDAGGYAVYTAGTASSVPWSGVTGTPTTLAGYGITDYDDAAKAAAVADAIVDGVTDVAPSQNAVFDALALKADASAVASYQGFVNDNAGSITARQFVYIKSNGAVDKATPALATFETTVLVVKDATIATTATGNCYTEGDTVPGFTGLTPGKPLFVHASVDGSFTQDPTTITSDNLYQVGYAVSATQMVYAPRHIVEL